VFRVHGLGRGVWGVGFGVWGSGFWVLGSGFRVPGSGFRVSGFGFRVSGSGFRVSGFGVRVSGFGFRFLRPIFKLPVFLKLTNTSSLCSRQKRGRRSVAFPKLACPHMGSKLSFSIALICTTGRQISASASANQGPAKGDLIPF